MLTHFCLHALALTKHQQLTTHRIDIEISTRDSIEIKDTKLIAVSRIDDSETPEPEHVRISGDETST